MDKIQKGRFTLVKDGDYYEISEKGLHVVSIHKDDLADVAYLLTQAARDLQEGKK